MNRVILSALVAASLLTPSSIKSASFGPYEAETVLFLGDSITHAGHYIAFIEARLRQDNNNQVPRIINLGLPSETCSGLSEPDHPFPRPNVHERLDRALAKIKPDLVFACYGMNDGIYHPFSEERFAAYQRGIRELIRKVTKTGAKLVLITPPPFDPLPLRKKGKLLPLGREKYAWFEIYEDYDQVLERYSMWLATMADKVDGIIDVRTPILRQMELIRAKRKDFTTSNDGVHINKQGHEIFANAMLKQLNLPGTKGINKELLKLVEARHKASHVPWLTHVGHKRPGPNSKKPFEESVTEANVIGATIARWFRSNGWAASVQFPESEKPIRLFNGKNLSGWKGLEEYWWVKDGLIRGANETKVLASTYLFTEKSYRDFRLVFEVKQTVGKKYSTMHSAVCVLGQVHEDKGGPYGFKGPLLMFCHDWGIWDAYRRNRIYPPKHRGGYRVKSEKKGDWNRIEVLVKGNRIRFVNNGELVIDFTDQPEMLTKSPIGLQLHSNGRPQEFHFRGLYLSENPEDRLLTLKK